VFESGKRRTSGRGKGRLVCNVRGRICSRIRKKRTKLRGKGRLVCNVSRRICLRARKSVRN